MPNQTPAETPEPFPSVETPTPRPNPSVTPSPSYRELERRLTPLPDSSHRPTPAEEVQAEVPREPQVKAMGGDNAFPNADTVRAAVAALDNLDAADLELDVRSGSVTLSGSVARSSDRDRIITALGKVHGVTEVVDHLRIRLE